MFVTMVVVAVVVMVVVMGVVTFLGSVLGGRATSFDHISMNFLSSPSLDQIDSMMNNTPI